MIRIIADLNRLVEATDELVVCRVADYVHAYARVLDAYETKTNLTLFVQVPAVEHWFRQMAERYPEGSFAFERIDARNRLQDLWGIPIPETVSPADIVAAGLLELGITPDPNDRLEDFLLAVYYDPLYGSRELPLGQLAELLDTYDSERWEQNKRQDLVHRIYADRINQWRNRAKSAELSELIARLGENPQSLRRDLVKFKVLRSYKDLGHKLLGDEYAVLDSLHLNLHRLAVDERTIPDVCAQVEYVLRNLSLPQNTGQASVLVSGVSGYLVSEFDFIEDILANNPELLSDAVISDLEEKFDPLRGRLGKRIAKLAKLIPPNEPGSPNKGWDMDRMLAWAIQEYLPYQGWCDANSIVDLKLYDMADVFASWLYDNWHEIHANSKRMVFNILPNHARELGQGAGINLILVIDNLGWMHISDLEELFQEHGLYLMLSEPYLSMVPSETEVSKKCLLAGSPTYQAIDDRTYAAIIEKGWVPYFNKAAFRYLSDPGKLKDLKEVTAQTYVVNYRAVDTALHMSSAQLGLPHGRHVHNILAGFVETVVDFVKRHDLDTRIKIHVVTDHGSLRIPTEVPNDVDSESFKGADFPRLSHRFVGVTNKRFEKLPDNLRADCFFIPSTEFGNEMHYLCARRANRFLATGDDFYVHGGLSPEELIVPHLVFESAVTPVQDLTVIMVSNEFRYRLETVELEIGNPNKYPVENIQIATLNSNFGMEPQQAEWLDGRRNIQILARGLFRQTANADERRFLSFRIRYKCHGERFSQIVRLPISMKTMVELRDVSLFEDLD